MVSSSFIVFLRKLTRIRLAVQVGLPIVSNKRMQPTPYRLVFQRFYAHNYTFN